jgi:hypothetical protein
LAQDVESLLRINAFLLQNEMNVNGRVAQSLRSSETRRRGPTDGNRPKEGPSQFLGSRTRVKLSPKRGRVMLSQTELRPLRFHLSPDGGMSLAAQDRGGLRQNEGTSHQKEMSG